MAIHNLAMNDVEKTVSTDNKLATNTSHHDKIDEGPICGMETRRGPLFAGGSSLAMLL